MKKSKKTFLIKGSILDKIVNSVILSDKEKQNFLSLIWYMTNREQKELASLI